MPYVPGMDSKLTGWVPLPPGHFGNRSGRRDGSSLPGTRAKSPAEPPTNPYGEPYSQYREGSPRFPRSRNFQKSIFFRQKSKFQKSTRLISSNIVLLNTPKFAAYRSPWRSLGKSYKIPTRSFTGKPRRCLVLLGFTKVSLVKPSIYGFPTQIPGRHFVRFP